MRIKWALLVLLFCLFSPLLTHAQTAIGIPCTKSPNVGFSVPSIGDNGFWGYCLNADVTLLDFLLGGNGVLTPTSPVPTVNGKTTWVTNNSTSTTITNFTNGFPGQTIVVICGASDTFTQMVSGTFLGLTSPWACPGGLSISLKLIGTKWVEMARSGGATAGGSCSPVGASGTLLASNGAGSCVVSSLLDNGTLIATSEIIQATAFQTGSAHPALGSTVRLAPNDSVGWRNLANSGDNNLATTTFSTGNVPTDTLQFTGPGVAVNWLAVQLGTSIAASGGVRFPSTGSACWRNNANSADICLSSNSADQFNFSNSLILPLNAYYPLFGGGANPIYAAPSFIEVSGQMGASPNDLCAKYVKGFQETGNNGNVVNGLAFVGNQSCSTNPLVNLTAGDSNITAILPCRVITTTVGWVFPVSNGIEIDGMCGRNGASVLTASSVASAYPANTPLITIGATGSIVDNDMFSHYRLDCSSAPQYITGTTPLNCSPLSLIGINEHSGVVGVTMKGQDNSTNTVPCVFIGDTASGSAPGHFDFKNNDIGYCGLNDFIDFYADGAAMGHFDDLTLNSSAATNKGIHGLHAQDNFGSGHTLNVGQVRRLHFEGGTGYSLFFDQGTFGEGDTIDCTGTCGGVFQSNTNYGYIMTNLSSVSGGANIVNNLNASAVGTLQIPNSVSARVQLYAQSDKDNSTGQENGVYHTMAFHSKGLVVDELTTLYEQYNSPQTVTNCSTSGTVTFSMPLIGPSYKKVVVYEAACLGTATYSFPTSFAHVPQVLSQSLAATETALSAFAVTITGSTSTGFLELDGF